jgi:hypothetical protein
MGIDYQFSLGIGFILDREDVVAPFRVEVPEKFHMEDRFDPKTGKPIEPVKVIDEEAGEAFVVDGTTYEDGYDFFEALGSKLGCSIANQGGYSDGETLYLTVDVERTDEDYLDDGRISVGSSIAFDNVTASRAAIMELSKKLKKLGIEPGTAKVFVQSDIS